MLWVHLSFFFRIALYISLCWVVAGGGGRCWFDISWQGKSGFDKTKFSQTVSWSLNWIELSTLLSLSALSPTVVAWHSTMTLATERNPLFSECRVERERHPKLNWFTRHFLTFTAFLTFILSGVELLLSFFFVFFSLLLSHVCLLPLSFLLIALSPWRKAASSCSWRLQEKTKKRDYNKM